MGEIKGSWNMSLIYHSATKKAKELNIKNSLGFYSVNNSVVFRHDIVSKEIHPFFKDAEAIYSEPAWPAGYAIFCERANKTIIRGLDYSSYLLSILSVVYALKVPTYLIIGARMGKLIDSLIGDYIPDLDIDWTFPTKILGYRAYVLTAFLTQDQINNLLDQQCNIKNNTDIIEHVTSNHDHILDFSCGYGNIVESAMRKGKKFICSDFNGKCVYYVASELMGYREKNNGESENNL